MIPPLKEGYADMLVNDTFLRKMIIHMINNRVQNFTDPLTNTLVLLATTPLQFVFCESGLILFKTALLPVFPYHCLSISEKQNFTEWIHTSKEVNELCDSSGQFTLSIPFVPKQPPIFLCKKALLNNFVHVMQNYNGSFNNPIICSTLCNIIVQRFLAIVPVPSDVVSFVMNQLKLPSAGTVCPLLLQPTDTCYKAIAAPSLSSSNDEASLLLPMVVPEEEDDEALVLMALSAASSSSVPKKRKKKKQPTELMPPVVYKKKAVSPS